LFLVCHFAFVDVVAQKFAVASFVFPLETVPDAGRTGYTSRLKTGVEALDAPVCFVALCSDEKCALLAEKACDCDGVKRLHQTHLVTSAMLRRRSIAEAQTPIFCDA
jgi:hypothetical protein